MRLIDADALMCNVKRAVYTDDLSTTIAVGICESHIKDMPTIDAIPVEWLEHMKTAITLTRMANSIKDVLALWQRFGSKEQEAR